MRLRRSLRVVLGLAPRAALALLAACAGTGSVSDRSLSTAIRPIPAGVNVQTDVTEYVIRGATIAELQRSMAEQGLESGGRRFAGTARWRLNWRWEYERQVTRCAFKDVTVNILAQVDMPSWERDSTADARTIEWWERVRERLFDHEVGHVRLALQGAREIREATRFLTDGSCDALGQRANQIARNLMEKHRQEQRDYDERTAHGTRRDSLGAAARRRAPRTPLAAP